MANATTAKKPVAYSVDVRTARKIWAANKKALAEGQTPTEFIGFVGCNVSPAHWFGGWALAAVPSPDTVQYESFEAIYNSFYSYLPRELGRRVRCLRVTGYW